MNLQQAMDILSKDSDLREVYTTVDQAYTRWIAQVSALQDKVELLKQQLDRSAETIAKQGTEIARLKKLIIGWSLANDPDDLAVEALYNESCKIKGEEL